VVAAEWLELRGPGKTRRRVSYFDLKKGWWYEVGSVRLLVSGRW
jgi:hypothetical protein